MTDDFNLTPNQLDAMREIGNVGAGNAATALSQVLNKKIDMLVPKVSLIPIEDLPELVGGPDALIVAVFLRVYGKAPGNILFLMPKLSAFFMLDDLFGKPHGSTTTLGDLEVSALKEVGNILTGSYLNSFFHFTNISMIPSIPSFAMDMAGAILNIVLLQLGQMGDTAMLIETKFLADDDSVQGHFFLVPDPGSLGTLVKAVGVD